jgi:hypothetical protein
VLAVDPAARNAAGTLTTRQLWYAQCYTIAKKPKFSVQNGDIYAGGVFASGGTCPVNPNTVRIVSSLSNISGNNYSSLSEYGGFSLGA